MMKTKVKTILLMISLICMLSLTDTIPLYADNNKNTTIMGIAIDGYYDDWEDKPKSRITWNGNNGEANHDVALLKDEEYIYIYLRMHPSYQSPIPIDAIHLYVNNQVCQLFIRYANSQNTTDWRTVDLSKNGTYLNLHPFTYYPNTSLGDAAITVDKGSPNDTMEIRIAISSLEKAMNLHEGTINSGSKIELKMPNVGGETIQLLGTSSGAIIGVGLSILVVIFVILRRDKKMRLTK